MPNTTEQKEATHVNKEYKDRLFKFVFGNPDHKDWTLSLYNAVNGTAHTDLSTLDYTTVEDVVYMNMKNDVSFLVDYAMNLKCTPMSRQKIKNYNDQG